jgi:hypothetical protein
MKCEECRPLIDDYAYGELDERASARLSAHLSGCAACSEAYEQAQTELEIFMRYEREVDVTPALWAAVEARIKEEKVVHHKSTLARFKERFAEVFRAPRLSPAFAAAMVVVAIGVTVAVTTFFNSGNGNQNAGQIAGSQNNSNTQQPGAPSNQPASSPQPGQNELADGAKKAASGESRDEGSHSPAIKDRTPAPKQQLANAKPPTADQLVKEAEQKYLAAISLLERDVKKTNIDPAMRARFDVALAEIDRTIAETRQVARKNPGDTVAAQYLLGAYSKKVDVLREMSKESVPDDQD